MFHAAKSPEFLRPLNLTEHEPFRIDGPLGVPPLGWMDYYLNLNGQGNVAQKWMVYCVRKVVGFLFKGHFVCFMFFFVMLKGR